MSNDNPSFTYNQITGDMLGHIEFVAGLVRSYRAEGKLDHADTLADSLWSAFRLWERITHGQQRDGDALRLEQAIEYVRTPEAPANPQ
jgi:hypothetical protein